MSAVEGRVESGLRVMPSWRWSTVVAGSSSRASYVLSTLTSSCKGVLADVQLAQGALSNARDTLDPSGWATERYVRS